MSDSLSSSSRVALRPPHSLLAGVFLVSMAVLGFEVALTRVFSALLRYHFAFLAMGLALCGLGLGGFIAHVLRSRIRLLLPVLAALFGVSIHAALAVLLRGVFMQRPDLYWLSALLVLLPFTVAGVFLAEAFARFPMWSGRLYGWDLAGAALAAVGVIGLLQVMGAVDACLFLGALGASAGFLMPSEKRWTGGIPGLAMLLLTALTVLNMDRKWLDIPPIPPMPDAQGQTLADRSITQPLFTELGTPGHTSHIVETRSNAFARTDVVSDTQDPDTLLLYTNGNVPTNMMRWDGQIESIGNIAHNFPLSDWVFLSALRNPKGSHSVLSIGPGGGMDALLALHQGAQRFDGAELNPSIIGLMHDYEKWNGGIYERPEVHVETADGRAFVREAVHRRQKYTLVFSALTKTATAGQGMALLESFIHTRDAFADYLDVLEPEGQLALVVDNPLLVARFYATAVEEFKARGENEAQASRHIALMYDERPGPYQYAIVVQKTAFSRLQTFDLYDGAVKRQLTPIWIPDQAQRDDFGPYAAVAAGKMDLDGFIRFFSQPSSEEQTPLNVAPEGDNRPFVLDLSLSPFAVFAQSPGLSALLGVGIFGLLLLSLGAVFWPERKAENQPAHSSVASRGVWALYFLTLGVGFLLIEIPLSQKLILPLGYPTLALTVTLFSLLLGGGLGAWVSQLFAGVGLKRWGIISALGVAGLTFGSVFLLREANAALLDWDLNRRCLTVAGSLLPLGFLLGAPFPSGLRLFADSGNAARVPLIWALNGVASVIGSLIAAMGAKMWGFEAIMQTGAVLYLFAALLMLLAQIPTRTDAILPVANETPAPVAVPEAAPAV